VAKLQGSELDALRQLLDLGPLGALVGGRAAGGAAAGLGKSLLGSDVVRAILVWQVLGQVAGPLLEPLAEELRQLVSERFPDLPLSPEVAADAAIRGHLDPQAAAQEAAKGGIDAERFRTLLANAGEAPAVGVLLELWRRGVIPEQGAGADAVSVEQGIKEGRTHDKWIEALKRLRYSLPSPESALQALLEGQTDEATARDLYARWGGDPEHFQLLFETRGSAPTPLEAAEMARRGVIPWEGTGPGATSYQQAFLEGPWRNKWSDPYRALAQYLPPPRTVTAMVREGSLTDDQALQLYREAGLSEELAAAYLASAHNQRTQADRELSKSDVLDLYQERALDREAALGLLQALRYSQQDAEWLLDARDFRVAKQLLDSALSRLRSLYVARKLPEGDLRSALGVLKVPSDQVEQLLQTWTLERALNVKALTAAEIADAVWYELISVEEGLSELEALGYSPRDAWLRLGVRLHGPPTAQAPADTLPPQ
jgi:hypothetical protein